MGGGEFNSTRFSKQAGVGYAMVYFDVKLTPWIQNNIAEISSKVKERK